MTDEKANTDHMTKQQKFDLQTLGEQVGRTFLAAFVAAMDLSEEKPPNISADTDPVEKVKFKPAPEEHDCWDHCSGDAGSSETVFELDALMEIMFEEMRSYVHRHTPEAFENHVYGYDYEKRMRAGLAAVLDKVAPGSYDKGKSKDTELVANWWPEWHLVPEGIHYVGVNDDAEYLKTYGKPSPHIVVYVNRNRVRYVANSDRLSFNTAKVMREIGPFVPAPSTETE